MKKAIIGLGLVMVMFFGVSYVYAQEQGNPPRHGWMHGEKSWGQGKTGCCPNDACNDYTFEL